MKHWKKTAEIKAFLKISYDELHEKKECRISSDHNSEHYSEIYFKIHDTGIFLNIIISHNNGKLTLQKNDLTNIEDFFSYFYSMSEHDINIIHNFLYSFEKNLEIKIY